jgi:hypothetical protein
VKSGAGGIAIDARGDAFIAGTTAAASFPTTTGAFQRSPGAYRGDAFVSELDPSGGRLLYSTYLGGSGDDAGLAMALGPGDHVYVTGRTISSDFPTTAGAYQRKPRETDGYAAFVAQLDPSGAPVPGLSAGSARIRGAHLVLAGRLDPAAKGRLSASARWRGHSVAATTRRRRARFTATAGPLLGAGQLRLTLRFRGAGGWEGEEICRKAKISGKPTRRGVRRLPTRRC